MGRRKRRKIADDHHPSDENLIGADGVDIGGIWIPDGVLFHIYSYMYEITLSTKECGVASLVHNIAHVSTEFLASFYRHVQKTPLNLYTSTCYHRTDDIFEWACQHKVKLGKYTFKLLRSWDPTLCTKLFEACDISELESCSMSLVYQHNRQKDGISDFVQHDSKLEFQRFFAEYVSKHAPSLKRLHIKSFMEELHMPLLAMFSPSLEELDLQIWVGSHDNNFPEHLSRVIGELSKLKKLKVYALNHFLKQVQIETSVLPRIHSKSLEMIDVMGCANKMIIEKCDSENDCSSTEA